MRSLIIFIISILFLTSCEKTVLLDLRQTPSKVAIEGLITDKENGQYIRITNSLGFYDNESAPRITDAVVSVSDDLGNNYTFVHNPESKPALEGVYFPATPFVGQVGRTYKLTVDINGERYEGEDYLGSIITMDSLSYDIDQEEFDDPEDPGYFYAVKMYAKEPQDEENFYLFKFFRNDTLVLDSETDIYYTDDEAIGENIDGIEAPGFYRLKDTVTVHSYSLSRQAFVFYNDLSTLLNNDGGMFSPPPANSRNNLSNGALGFFQASAVDVSSVIIK
jgi:Domain of unknown function (DUF4249)